MELSLYIVKVRRAADQTKDCRTFRQSDVSRTRYQRFRGFLKMICQSLGTLYKRVLFDLKRMELMAKIRAKYFSPQDRPFGFEKLRIMARPGGFSLVNFLLTFIWPSEKFLPKKIFKIVC